MEGVGILAVQLGGMGLGGAEAGLAVIEERHLNGSLGRKWEYEDIG